MLEFFVLEQQKSFQISYFVIFYVYFVLLKKKIATPCIVYYYTGCYQDNTKKTIENKIDTLVTGLRDENGGGFV